MLHIKWDKLWPDGPTWHIHVVIMYGLLTKCEVKMVGYWPSSLFAYLWTETKSRSIDSQKKKKEHGQYPAILTEQTWSVNKGFIIWLLVKFCLRDMYSG